MMIMLGVQELGVINQTKPCVASSPIHFAVFIGIAIKLQTYFVDSL
jgi:hypothetical protein